MNSERLATLARAKYLVAGGEMPKVWEGAALLGDLIGDHDAIWPLVVHFASSDDPEVRAAIACCVLEHILEHHFEQYFNESKRLIEAGNERFADTFSSCWAFGQTELPGNKEKFDALVQQIEG